MNIIKKSALFFILPMALVSMLPAQEIHRLDLETSILLAKEQSNRMLILRQQLKGAAYNLKAATSAYKTNVSMDLILPQYTETMQQWQDSTGITFYPLKQSQMRGTLNIMQPLPTDGNLYVRTGILNYVDYYANDRNAQFTSSVGLQQPIEAFFGYNNNRLGVKQAKLAYELSMKQLKRAELDLVYDISQKFYTLLSFHERMNIAKLSLEKQTEAYAIAQSKFKAGLIREVEALQMEVDLSAANNNYDMAKVEYNSQASLFKESLGINLRDSVIIKSDLEYKSVLVDVEKAVELAMENRLELRENEIQIALQEMTVKRQKAAGMPSGDIMLNYNFIGVGEDYLSVPIGTTFDRTWQNLTDRPGSFGVGLTASIPIVDWGRNRARVNSALATLEQNHLQLEGNKVTIEREIRTEVEQMQSSLRRLQLLEKNVLVAEKSFDISRQRYANGEIDSQAMALERERLNTAYNSRLDSYINYKLLISDIMRKTFYDFENNKSVD
ncbi:MAG: TolC family protein [Bacteroidota bacterium]